jgi:hypothetical protein
MQAVNESRFAARIWRVRTGTTFDLRYERSAQRVAAMVHSTLIFDADAACELNFVTGSEARGVVSGAFHRSPFLRTLDPVLIDLRRLKAGKQLQKAAANPETRPWQPRRISGVPTRPW